MANGVSISPIDSPEVTEILKVEYLRNEANGSEEMLFEKIQQSPSSALSRKGPSRSPPTCLQNTIHYFSQYCKTSGVHGVQYLGERGRFLIEKFMWTITILTVCCSCLYLITKTYHKWRTSPVIVTFATAEVPIWEIPFPAVTICPEVKSNPEIFNYTDVYLRKLLNLGITAEEERHFKNFRIVCKDYLPTGDEFNLDNGNFMIDYFDFLLGLLEALPLIDPYNITEAYWLGKAIQFGNDFSYTFTSDGFCYSFNMLHYEEIYKDADEIVTNKSSNASKARKWSLESGYPNDDSDSFPRRTFLSGMRGGLTVEGLFVNHSHLDHLCSEFLQGFKVVLHHPSELPNMDKHFRVPLDQAVFVGITPSMTTVSEELKSYGSEDRKCYLADERPLMIFKSYTQQNCLHECLYNYTLLTCGCAPFYILHGNDTLTCGVGNAECVEESKVKYLSKEGGNCNCMPFCTSLEYNVEVTQTDWNWREMLNILRPLESILNETTYTDENFHLSKLVVFYNELQFLPSERHELYGYTDFFSNVGGLLGLFIGFSVTSFVEIIYFVTLRLVCNIKKFGRNFWSGASELIHGENPT